MRKAGVLPTRFVAPARPRLVAAQKLPDSYSWIEGTPITLGQNDIYGDCTCCAAWNAGYITAMRSGIVLPMDETGPFKLYQTLGGMPADVGLDPEVVFDYWKSHAINGFRLENIYALPLDDVPGMKESIIDLGFIYVTATLTDENMQQDEWVPTPDSPVDGGHAFLGTGFIADRATDDTWGKEQWFKWNFLPAQGRNVWRCELEAA